MSNQISWDDQRIFLAVLEEGSLSAAARKLGLSQPTVRKRLEILEHALGCVLFTRSVNGLTPTPKARNLHDAAKKMALASDLFVRQSTVKQGEISGRVRLSVPDFMGIEVVPDFLTSLNKVHPAIQIELELSNKPANLLDQEVDIAIRTIAPHQDALIAKQVPPIQLGFFASKKYLAKRDIPQNLSDFEMHNLIGPDRNRTDIAIAQSISPHFSDTNIVLKCDNHPAHLSAARAGLGIAVAQIPAGNKDPNLVRILPDYIVADMSVWVVTHENFKHDPRIRAVFDHLVRCFSKKH